MNYEEKYKEALERAEEIIRYYKEHNRGDEAAIEDLETIFPELAENEDEKVRQILLDVCKMSISDIWEKRGCKKEQVIAWLEKQGEQKPIIEMKSPEESLGIDSDIYNNIVDECIYGEQKPQRMISAEAKEALYDKTFWSEEDERICQETIDWFEKKCFPYTLEHENPARESIRWLKSIKQRIGWKPSEKQMKALHDLNLTGNISYAGQGQVLIELYNDLKKLKENSL